jgi:lipoprotein-releasing system ATP-binding protein
VADSVKLAAQKNNSMIATQHLHKYFDELHVLNDINLKIDAGEVISIVGASGAGKTTLLQILGTLDSPSQRQKKSKLFIDNTDLYKLSKKELSRFRNEHIGFIFQFHQLLPEFTALENVCIPAFIKKQPKTETETRAKELLKFLGLESRSAHKPNQLSGGEQQRVAVARALINNPKVILADEPSGNLDSESAENLHKLFFDLRAEFGQTFVIVTHNEELADMADRKLTMVDGKIDTEKARV